MDHPNSYPLSAENSSLAHLVIVTQVKSNRVVYFTDDPDYQPPMEGDWYYCSPYNGVLPAGMTLRNCWGWRFNGGVFADARGTPNRTAHETLIESNRKTLLHLLHTKIDAVREPFMPSCTHGDSVRQIKLREAEAYLAIDSKNTSAEEIDAAGDDLADIVRAYPHLKATAIARNICLLDAARLIVARSHETRRVLLETERFRESLSQAIHTAQTQAQLLQIRVWLLDEVYPELSREFKFRVEDTEPLDFDKPLGDTHRHHEVARLKAQLREVINSQRAGARSDYVQNDEIRKHKARLAQSVLLNGGIPPQGIDITLLESYARARKLDLDAAAQLIVNSMAASAELLARSEILKDQMLARIEQVQSLADVRAVAADLTALERT